MTLTPQEFLSLVRNVPSRVRAMNVVPALEACSSEVFASVELNFGRQVDDNGESWPPRTDNFPHPLLILTGDMLEAASGGLGSYVRYTPDSMEMGVRLSVIPYARRQQEGDEEVNLPARKYFYLNVEERPKVLMKFGDRASSSFYVNVLQRRA